MMLVKSVFLAAFAALAAASPLRRHSSCSARTPPTATVSPTLPLNGGATELPDPSPDLTLKYIALGHGIQNYTCATADPSVPGTATGALAVLYDATPFFPNGSPSALASQAAWESLPVTAALDLSLPLTMDTDTSGCVLSDHPGASLTAPFPSPPAAAAFSALGISLPALGQHYFSSSGVPTFDLGSTGLVLSSSLLDKIPAPSSASAGPDGQAAVAWLRLGSVAGGYSHGLSEVYRVNTVGGSSPKCTAAGTISVPYATFYWFYGHGVNKN